MDDGSDRAPARRTDLSDLAALRILSEEVTRSVGPRAAPEVMFRIGYVEGHADALAVVRGLEGQAPPLIRFAGPGVSVLFTPDRADLSRPFGGRLQRSGESELSLATGTRAEGPICFLAAGYASGWFSGLLSEPLLVREVACRAAGADACVFEAERAPAEGDPDGPDDEDDAVDFAPLDERALAIAEADSDGDGPLLGQFGPLSPAAHIWGPVMILPYAGYADSADAVASVQHDIGPNQVRVVVVDLTGAKIDALEASGLARLLDGIESLGGDAILVGLRPAEARPFIDGAGSLAYPLCTDALADGIRLALQLCAGSCALH